MKDSLYIPLPDVSRLSRFTNWRRQWNNQNQQFINAAKEDLFLQVEDEFRLVEVP